MQGINREKSLPADQPRPKASIDPRMLVFILMFRSPASPYIQLCQRPICLLLGISWSAAMEYIQITISKSKIDQKAQEAHVCLAPIAWHHNNLLQPFSSMKNILAFMGSFPDAAFMPSFNKQSGTLSRHLGNDKALAIRLRWCIKLPAETFLAVGLRYEQFAMHTILAAEEAQQMLGNVV